MSENVIHLSFKSPHMVDDAISFIACRVFLNKTYTLIEDRPNDFQLEVRCMRPAHGLG